MNKYQKTRKLEKEFGISRNEARKLLRQTGWDITNARLTKSAELCIESIKSIDWVKVGEEIAKGLQRVTEAMERMISTLPEILNAIEEETKKVKEEMEAEGEKENEDP